MNDLAALVSDIEKKARNLADRLSALEIENKKLKSRLNEAEVSLNLQKSKVKELENKNSILKVSGSLGCGNGKQDRQKAGAVIDGLVREIDRCLMLLDAFDPSGKETEPIPVSLSGQKVE
ncbi:MAG: hypothetical protein NC048_01270 [Bacteroides sp.]|nr:hypothetical protein [Ruminococcus flavefaciens]MCM1554110.1 hypothetical protein [Bacteroides sp.]